MSGFRMSVVGAVAAGLLAVAAGTARADVVRGDFAGWASDDWALEFNAGNYYSLSKQATAGGSEMKFNNGGDWWGQGTSATVNGSIGLAHKGGDSNLELLVVQGEWYTFHVAGHGGWTDRPYLVMKTHYKPATIAEVTDNHVTQYDDDVGVEVRCVLSTNMPSISTEEVFYLVYTADDWATQTRQVMTKSGVYARGTIPGQTAGTTVKYYVFSSAMPTNLFTDARFDSANANGETVSIDQFGFCMLSADDNGGACYSYTTVAEDIEYVAGNVWHCPTNTEPYASATMRAPVEVALGDHPYIRLGVYPASGSDAPTKVQLKYKAGTNSWATLTMKPEPHGDGWQSQYDSNAYYTNYITTNKFTAGMTVQYYFVAEFENSGQYTTTYVGTTNQTGSVAYLGADEAKAHPFQFTVGAAPVPDPGNVWHVPGNLETWGRPMRDPLEPGDGATPFLRLGNQSDVQDGWMTAANIKYRVGTSGAWSSIPMGWEEGAGGEGSQNAYWSNALPAVVEGQTVQYYFEAEFGNSASLGTTYVFDDGADGCDKGVEEAEAQASPFEFTVSGRVYNLGNAWHVPAAAEPAGAYMRNPTHPYASSPVAIYNGNQAQGDGGNPGDQSGGTVYYRAAGASSWSEAAMEYDTAVENNKYWRGAIPADAFAAASTVEYVIKVAYNDHDDTYLGLAAAGDVASSAFGTLEEAAAHPFDFTYAGEAGQEPAFVWHGGNAVKMSGTNVQLWVKTGYVQGDDAWADQAQIRYKVVVPAEPSSTARQGVRAIRRAKGAKAVDPSLAKTVEMRFDHTDEDPSGLGKAMWWVGSVQEADLAAPGAVLRYQIAVRRTTAGGGNGTWRLAEYQSAGANDTVFEYTMASSGANTLTVNGLNADYTTSKFFIDESKGETAHLHVVYAAPAGATDVQIFSNVGRRDYWGADLDGNGVPDAIRPPSGDLVTTANTATTNTYFGAWAMEWDADAGVYTWDADIGKTGAYRLTARYKQGSKWHYYSELGSGIRDHAIVISPKKVLEQNIYEVNGMTAKASAPDEAGHSTFEDLIEGADGYAEFGVPYLNNIGANCLWFQPIHTSSEYGLAPGGEPGSPYAAKDYFSVSRWYGKAVGGQRTTAQALSEFQDFVAACDAGSSPGMRQAGTPSKVGTINIMLDGVFNHTSWDAVFGVMGERMGIVPAGTGASTAIASVKPGWYANVSDYGAPATWYNGPQGGNHDIASGPDRGDFGKWLDTAELFYGDYSALVRHNPDDNGNYLNESDQYNYESMTADTEMLWEYMGSYVPYWLDQTGHDFGNERTGEVDENGTAYDDYGIDGLRCDFGQGLPPQFWEYCINRARAKKWNFMFMAESLDGGKVSYRSNRHFDILNESFVFAARNAGSPSDLLAVTDDKKAAYNGGAVLLNLTSHDEVMPYDDPWKTASRYAMLATVKGLPMTFYGQEQGIIPCDWGSDWAGEGTIIQPGNASFGFSKFELNFGKWVADFKTWNKMTIWDEPPMGAEASHGMAQLYGHVNWARASSPALQSDVQWMLDRVEGYRSADVWAMAKAEEYGALANGKDAVLAFVLFVNDTHYATQQTFAIPAGAAAMLGLEAGESYTARNLASSDAEQILWTKTTEELTGEGVWVDFPADQDGSAFYDDGAMVQFLKLEKYVPPATHDITVTVGANGSVSPDGTVTVEDGGDQEFTITADAGYRIESVLADGVAVATFGDSDTTYTYTWENVTADGTLWATFVEQTVEPEFVPSAGGVDVPVAWMEANYPGMTYEEMLDQVDEPAANGKDTVWQCYIADLDPTDPDAAMVVGREIDLSNGVSFKVDVPAGRTAEVCYKDDMTGATQEGWQAFDPAASYSNTGTDGEEWTFEDPTWNGTTIRFYQLQMKMNQ